MKCAYIKLLFILFVFFPLKNYSQQYAWLNLIESSDYLEIEDVEEKDDFVYLVGSYRGTIKIESTIYTSVPSFSFAPDIFLAKYDTMGNVIWTKSIGNDRLNNGKKITVDDNGNIYLHGLNSGSTQFDSFTLHSYYFERDQFVAKLNSQGVTQWVKSIDISTPNPANSHFHSYIELSSQGNLFIASDYRGDLKYDSSLTPTMSCFSCSYLLKIDTSNGNLLATKNIDSPNNYNDIGGMIVNDNESVILTGDYKGTLSVDSYSVSSTYNVHMYVLKLSPTLNAVWLKSSELPPFSSVLNYEVRPDDAIKDGNGNIYIGGRYLRMFKYDGITTQDIGESTYPFLLKMTPNGDGVFLKTFETDTAYIYSGNRIYNIEVDKGFLYATGNFSKKIQMGSNIMHATKRDIFTFKMDTAGNILWGIRAGGANDDFGRGIDVSASGSIYSMGTFNGLSNFGSTLVNSTSNNSDWFFSKLIDCSFMNVHVNIIGDTNFCDPGSVQFITSNMSGAQYQWLKDGNFLSGENNPDYLAISSGSYAVIVNSNGCSDTSRAIQVKEGTAPPNISLNLKDSVCQNDPFLLLNGIPSGGRYIGSGVVNNEFHPSMANIGTNRISYVVDSTGCADTAFADVHVAEAPGPVISGNTHVCGNSSGHTYTLGTTSTLPTTLNWGIQGGSIVSGQGTNSITVDWGGSGQGWVSLQESNAFLCDSTYTLMVDVVGQQFQGEIYGSDTICTNTAIATHYVNNPSLFYNWTVQGGSMVSGQGTNSVHIDWHTAGTGILSVHMFNNCGKDTIFYDTVTVGAPPTPMIQGTTVACEGSQEIYLPVSTGNSYQWRTGSGGNAIGMANRDTLMVEWKNAGMEHVELIETNAFNCTDSTTMNVEVLADTHTVVNEVICYGSTYVFGGISLSQSGTYTDTLVAANSCDSVVMLTLNLWDLDTSTVNAAICQGSTYNFGGKVYVSAGLYHDTLANLKGCDSIVSLNLSVLPNKATVLNGTICDNTVYSFGNRNLSVAGTYYDTLVASNSCDSVVTLHLNILPTASTSLSASICQGGSYSFGGKSLTVSGTYHDTLFANNSCDSIVTLSLNVLPIISSTLQAEICKGDSYNFNGQTLTISGTYHDTLQTILGCDSQLVLNLNILPLNSTSLSASICQGNSYSFGGRSLSVSGTYHDTLLASNSCDSIVTLSLNILPIISSTLQAEICNGDSFSFNGQTLTTSGSYYDTLQTTLGCDSQVVLNLNILPLNSTSLSVSICQGSSYSFGGKSLSVSGTYHDTLVASNSCDSMVALTLNVLPIKSGSIQVDICNGGSYNFNGQTLTSSGTYHDTLQTTLGCDSIVSLLLTELSPINTILNESICSGNAYDFNGKLLSSAGNYSDTLVSFLGCDSVIDLSLSVKAALNDSIMRKKDSLIAFEPLANYQWYSCDLQSQSYTAIAGANMRYLVPNDSNYYAVEVSLNACVDTSDCQRPLLLTGIGKEQLGSVLRVYPNPTRGVVHLEASFSKIEEINIEIRDIHGKLVYQEQQYLSTREFNHEFDLSGNAKGVYIIKISSTTESIVKKIVLN